MTSSHTRNDRFVPLLPLLLFVCLTAGVGLLPASAEIGTLDEVPAATLLLPYFEVDLNDPQGVNTVFTIANARQDPAIVHVVLWSDWSVATLDFNAYLTGFDVVDVDLQSLFLSGVVPSTSHNNPGISNVGSFSLATNPDTGVGPGTASCNAQLPLPPLPFAILTHIRNAHTGQPSALFGGACSGSDLGDDVARGYVTVDNVDLCTLDYQGDAGYFVDGGAGVANNVNALLGSYRIVEGTDGLAHGGAMVHLEASSDDPRTAPGRYTFYARYSGGADNREPLASAVAVPYVSGNTDLIYWRDSRTTQNPIACGSSPLCSPLANNQVVFFDQQESPEVLTAPPIAPPIPIPLPHPFAAEAGRVTVGSMALPVSFERGWAYLNLGNVTGSALDPLAQGWVGVVERDPSGLFATSQPAWQLFNTSEDENLWLPCVGNFPAPLCGEIDGIFADGFESGSLAGWVASVP